MLRTASALLLFAVCVLWGFSRSYTLDARVKKLKCILSDLDLLQSETELSGTPLRFAVGRVKFGSEELWSIVADSLERGENGADAWRRVLESRALAHLSTEDVRVVAGYFERLGRLDMTHQEAAYRSVAVGLARQIDEAERLRTKGMKLFSTLGALGGLAFALLVI